MNWNDIVPGVVAVILAAGSIFAFLKQQKNLEKDISCSESKLSKEHDNLSKEHDNLSDKISEKHQQIQKQQDEIKQAVIYLKENTLLEQGKKEVMSQQTLDIKRTSDHISALVDLLHNTQVENINLMQENQELKSRLQQYIHREQEEEMEL